MKSARIKDESKEHPGAAIGQTKNAIIIFLHKVLLKGGRHYCTPGIASLLNQLSQIHKINIHQSWAYQCLADLQRYGFIYRQKRPRRTEDGCIRNKISMYAFTLVGIKFLVAQGVAGAREQQQKIIDYLRRNDRRFPTEPSPEPSPETRSKSESFSHIKDLLAHFT